jgi:hypothetical protein
MGNSWIDFCEPPRPRPPGFDWDVFVSYRSLDRLWSIALYDMLTQCGYKVFLDQFVLVPGQGLTSQLGRNLQRSASGVLLWSERAEDSKWVEKEIDLMSTQQTNSIGADFPFNFVVASLDGRNPPGLMAGQLYVDFSAYPDGPMGSDLVRLTCGLQGKPLSPDAVRQVVAFDATLKTEPISLKAMAKAGLYAKIVARLNSDEPAYTTSAQIAAIAIDLLIRGKHNKEAIEACEAMIKRFPGSIRLKQLYGLALRREKRLDEANYELNLLLENSHRDTETLGILAAVWADLWEKHKGEGNQAGASDALERSQQLYAEAFKKVPTDTYTGINAASKAALLGDGAKAAELAGKVLERLNEQAALRGGEPSKDYWERVTEPEALLLQGDGERALELYHAARVAHQDEKGSIASTATQLQRLLGVLSLPPDIKNRLAAEFQLQLE